MVNSFTSGTGTITQSGGMATLKIGTASGSWSYINTYYMLRYLVGQGNLIRFTALFTTGDGTKDVILRIARNATIGGTPVWNDINTNASVVQYDTSGTTAAGGRNLIYWGESKVGSNQMVPPPMYPFTWNPVRLLPSQRIPPLPPK